MSSNSVRSRHWSVATFFSFVVSILCLGCATAQSKAGSFRVMTYNIHHGEGTDGHVDLKRIADVIKKEGADIVGLQEVDRGIARSGKRDLPAELARLTGMKVFFDSNLPYQNGEYGNAVLTRFPILQATNTHYKMLEPREQRGVIQMVLSINDQKVLFMDTHLDFRPSGEPERLLHVQTMADLIRSYGKLPVIVCGDFNVTPDERPHQAMAKILRDTWDVVGVGKGFTIPSQRPAKRIDYIWISDDVEPKKISVPVTEASDHRPVVGEFQLKTATP